MLYLIGLGLNNCKDVSLNGLEAIKNCDKIFLENYTSKFNSKKEELEEFYGKKIELASRDLIEKNSDLILKDAKEKNVALLIIGDVFLATTHIDLKLRAKEKDIPVKIINNASVFNAVGNTGLDLYKFGKITSLSFHVKNPESTKKVMQDNLRLGYHTLVLLDLDIENNKYMKIKEALEILDLEMNLIGCSGLGSDKEKIVYSNPDQLKKISFGDSLQCLIIPGKLHFIEEEALKLIKT